MLENGHFCLKDSGGNKFERHFANQYFHNSINSLLEDSLRTSNMQTYLCFSYKEKSRFDITSSKIILHITIQYWLTSFHWHATDCGYAVNSCHDNDSDNDIFNCSSSPSSCRCRLLRVRWKWFIVLWWLQSKSVQPG